MADAPTAEDLLDGRARWHLHAGDALRFLDDLPPGVVDLFLTDPPYSSGGLHKGDRSKTPTEKYVHGTTKREYMDFDGDNRDQRSFIAWVAVWAQAARRAARLGAVLAVFSDWRQLGATLDAVQAGGWVYRGLCTWDKGRGSRPSPQGIRNQCEYVVWATDGRMRGGLGGTLVDGCLQIADVPDVPGVLRGRSPPGRERIHPTEKPVALLRELCRIAPPGGLVCDPFAGSGATGVAALASGRRFLGSEMAPHYHAAASLRLHAAARDATPDRPAP